MMTTFHGFAVPKAAVAVDFTVNELMPKKRMNVVGTVAVCVTRTALGREGETAFPAALLVQPDPVEVSAFRQGVVTLGVIVPIPEIAFKLPESDVYSPATAGALSLAPVLYTFWADAIAAALEEDWSLAFMT
jgi:hypothetical protein